MQFKNKINNYLTYFLLSHLVIWTIIPSISNTNLPLDTIEALAWGSNLEWGYSKHPPLSAFAVELFYRIFGAQDWVYYFLSQIFVILSFLIIFEFSKDFFKNTAHGLLSLLLLEGIFFYNFTTPEFNVNVCQLPFWTLSVLYCWRGIKNNKNLDWLLFGLFAAFGVLSKYLFIYLLAALDVFFIILIINKKFNFKCLISLITFLLVLTPHLFWLVNNDYMTITYAFSRTGLENSNALDHIFFPLLFLVKQTGILIPFFLLVLLLVPFKFYSKVKFNFKDKKLIFLLIINFLPIIFMFLTSLVTGAKIRTMWMTPFYLFFGVLIVYILQTKIEFNKIKNFFTLFIILFILSPATYLYISISQTNKRTDYPGAEIAYLVQSRWDKNFSNEISIVVGNEWLGGNLSYHLPSRPKWFNESIPVDLKFTGGVIYTGNKSVLKNVCPGIFGSIKNQGICMIGSK
jgi:4-amino-4-deoxy-L-arabinose transferase-like glycosyltransferase